MAKKNEVEAPMGEGERAEITGRPESGAEKDVQAEAAEADRLSRIAAQTESPASVVAKEMAGEGVKVYGVVRPVLHGTSQYHRGDKITLTPGQAKHLLETKAIGIISTEPVFLVDGEPIVSASRVLPLTDDVLLDQVIS